MALHLRLCSAYLFHLGVHFLQILRLTNFQQDNIRLEPLSEMYSDNVVGLSKEELEVRKKQEAEKLKALDEALRKIPMEFVNGKFVPMTGEKLEAELARRKAEEEARRKATQVAASTTSTETSASHSSSPNTTAAA